MLRLSSKGEAPSETIHPPDRAGKATSEFVAILKGERIFLKMDFRALANE